MTTIRARLLNFFLRHTVKRRLAAASTPYDVRRVFNSALSIAPRGVVYTPATLGGVPGEWVEARDMPAKGTLLYVHGGGYVAMSPRTHRAVTGAFARRGFRVGCFSGRSLVRARVTIVGGTLPLPARDGQRSRAAHRGNG